MDNDNLTGPRVFIGASRVDRARALEIAKLVEKTHCVVSSTWHDGELPMSDLGVDHRIAISESEVNCQQMRNAALAIFVRPSTPAGRGVWFELGYCVAHTEVWFIDGAAIIAGEPRIVERQSIYESMADKLILHDLHLEQSLRAFRLAWATR